MGHRMELPQQMHLQDGNEKVISDFQGELARAGAAELQYGPIVQALMIIIIQWASAN